MLSVVAVHSGKISAKANDGNINEILHRVCWHYVLVLTALVWIAYDEVKCGNHHKDLFCDWRYTLCLKIWHMPVIQFTSKGRVIDQLLLCSLLIFFNPQFVDVLCNVKLKSCSRSYVHFCVPWILDDFSNDPWTGTTNDFDCCLHRLSSHVGKCSIARPWFSQGLLGWGSLPLHL